MDSYGGYQFPRDTWRQSILQGLPFLAAALARGGNFAENLAIGVGGYQQARQGYLSDYMQEQRRQADQEMQQRQFDLAQQRQQEALADERTQREERAAALQRAGARDTAAWQQELQPGPSPLLGAADQFGPGEFASFEAKKQQAEAEAAKKQQELDAINALLEQHGADAAPTLELAREAAKKIVYPTPKEQKPDYQGARLALQREKFAFQQQNTARAADERNADQADAETYRLAGFLGEEQNRRQSEWLRNGGSMNDQNAAPPPVKSPEELLAEARRLQAAQRGPGAAPGLGAPGQAGPAPKKAPPSAPSMVLNLEGLRGKGAVAAPMSPRGGAAPAKAIAVEPPGQGAGLPPSVAAAIRMEIASVPPQVRQQAYQELVDAYRRGLWKP